MSQNLLLAIFLAILSAHVILSEEFDCPRSRGYYPHPTECKKYYSCRKRISTLKECPERMLFDVNKGNCYINSAVDCGDRKKPEVTIVTISEIEETATEVNWNTDLYTRTAMDKLSTWGITNSILPVKVSTSSRPVENTASNTVDYELKTNEIDIITHQTTTISDIESGTSENMPDDSSYIVTGTSDIKTDAEHENLSTTLKSQDYTSTTISDFSETSKINDEDVTDKNDFVSTEREKPGTINEDITSVTENSHPTSSIIEISETSRTVVDNSTPAVSFLPNLHTDSTDNVSEKTSENEDSSPMEITTERLDNELESSVSYLQSVSTSITSDLDFTTDKGEESLSSNQPHLTTFKPEAITIDEGNETKTTISDDKNFSDATGFTTDKGDESLSSNQPYLTTFKPEEITINEGNVTKTTISDDKNFSDATDFSTDKGDESLSSNQPHLTTFKPEAITIDEGNETKTTISDHKNFSDTTVTDFNDARSTSSNGSESMTSKLPSTMSDGTKLSSTVSNKETTNSFSDSTYVNKLDDATTISSSEFRTSSKIATTEQVIIKVTTEEVDSDEYYWDEFVCPTAYGLYPHRTNKHKFIQCQEWYPHVMVCPANLIFDTKKEVCVWPSRN